MMKKDDFLLEIFTEELQPKSLEKLSLIVIMTLSHPTVRGL